SLALLVVVRREMRSLAASETSLREKSESLEQSIMQRSAMEKRLVQSQKLEAVGQLTGGIAHDFNNLMLVVIGNLDLLKDATPAGPLEMDLIDPAPRAPWSESELSNILLPCNRQHAFKPETVDLKTIVDDQVRLLRHAIGRNVSLETRSNDDVFAVTVDTA